VNSLLEILSVSKQALNAPLRQLLQQNLVSMRPDERDRRFKRLTLTPPGKALEVQLTGTQMRHLAGVFAAAGRENAAAWKSIMRELPNRAR
jgi:DNA-binding MarR family transcriptional regulator